MILAILGSVMFVGGLIIVSRQMPAVAQLVIGALMMGIALLGLK